MRTLTKSNNKVVSGVCAGIAEYFGWDPVIVRIAWLIAVFCFGTGIAAYIIAAIIMPER